MKDLDEIIKLSKHPWIQERVPEDYPASEFLIYWNRTNRKYCPECRCYPDGLYCSADGKKLKMEDDGYLANKKEYGVWTWLPLGFNPETGNYQLDDLLMEAGGYKNTFEQDRAFDVWKHIDYDLDCYMNFDPIIAKLTWLNELVEGKE